MSIINECSFAWVLSCLFTWSSCVCNIATAGERTAESYLNETNLSIGVRNKGSDLLVVCKRLGEVFFQQTISRSDVTEAGVNIRRLTADLWNFRYKDSLSFNLDLKGNVYYIPEGNQDWTQLGKVGIRTFGTLESKSNLTASSLTTVTPSFVNFSHLRVAGPAQFFNNYLFNSGVIQLNDAPEGFAAPRMATPARGVQPDFKDHVVENYGTFTCSGKLLIKDRLSYNEHNNSTFNNLEMSGGDVTLNEETSMTVKEALTGSIGNINIRSNAGLSVGTVELPSNLLEFGETGLLQRKILYTTCSTVVNLRRPLEESGGIPDPNLY